MVNLIQMLSFDSRCVSALLDSKNCLNFQYDYPIFYKIRQNNVYETSQKTYSAIDIAIENNQSQALNLIIEYMVKY